jgi:hypothetical protein
MLFNQLKCRHRRAGGKYRVAQALGLIV